MLVSCINVNSLADAHTQSVTQTMLVAPLVKAKMFIAAEPISVPTIAVSAILPTCLRTRSLAVSRVSFSVT
jgi:hypothetical protein